MLKLSTRDAWAAGAQLMANEDPERWSAAQFGYRLVSHPENRTAIAACVNNAQQVHKDQRCTVVVSADRADARFR